MMERSWDPHESSMSPAGCGSELSQEKPLFGATARREDLWIPAARCANFYSENKNCNKKTDSLTNVQNKINSLIHLI